MCACPWCSRVHRQLDGVAQVFLPAHHFRMRGPRLCALNSSHRGLPSGFLTLIVHAPQLGVAGAAPAPFGATRAFADLAAAARDAVSGRAAPGTEAAPGPVNRPITSCTHKVSTVLVSVRG